MTLSPMYLSRPGVLSALGEGIEQNIARLLTPEAPPTLTRSDAWVQGRSIPVGQVKTPLRAFPDLLPEIHASRNNQLLWHAMQDLDATLHHALARFGAERVGVVLGTSTSGVDENRAAFQAVADGASWQDVRFSQDHQLLSSPASFIEQQYDLRGPCYSISTACTSGARALISAARLLRNNVCDAVVCGGVDCLSLLTINGFASLEVLSDQVAEPFAAARCGINIGEAAAVFVMSREPLDSDHAVYLGDGSSSDAWHMSSPRPDGAGAIAAIKAALSRSGLHHSDIGWINLHGTGTQLNDEMESHAVAACFGHTVCCTSTKPYTGHTLGAAGALEAAIAWGMLSRRLNSAGRLPPHHGHANRDPALPPLMLTGNNSHWPSATRRIALSSSFAFGGNNTVLLLGESS